MIVQSFFINDSNDVFHDCICSYRCDRHHLATVRKCTHEKQISMNRKRKKKFEERKRKVQNTSIIENNRQSASFDNICW